MSDNIGLFFSPENSSYKDVQISIIITLNYNHQRTEPTKKHLTNFNYDNIEHFKIHMRKRFRHNDEPYFNGTHTSII